MVAEQIVARGIRQPTVLEALRAVPRHLFVPEDARNAAYADHPLPIGHGQTISQPYIVALMTELLELSGGEKVLEIGTGSGYQAAVLAHLGAAVYSIEIVAPLAQQARRDLERAGYAGVHLRTGDGYRGWLEEAPFDRVILTAAPREIPEPLIDQLAVGGILVAPVGEGVQDLVVVRKTEHGLERRTVEAVRFVPMTGEAERRPGAPR